MHFEVTADITQECENDVIFGRVGTEFSGYLRGPLGETEGIFSEKIWRNIDRECMCVDNAMGVINTKLISLVCMPYHLTVHLSKTTERMTRLQHDTNYPPHHPHTLTKPSIGVVVLGPYFFQNSGWYDQASVAL